ncbi:Putative protein of unknown function [Podospora comata]|uniref:DUF7707 domain-containing protein n=1 Tax=Podospora comata TaxID=48703 RepID=A0ABY6S5R2_PODCO|nr:Putative protein of unknown function [Podospora comata]
MRFITASCLLAVGLGTSGVLSRDWEWDTRKQGYWCFTPNIRRTENGIAYYGNTVCPSQIKTCEAVCSPLGGTIPGQNVCITENNRQDDPDKRIPYCFKCQCRDESWPNLRLYPGSVARLVCEREAEWCAVQREALKDDPVWGKTKCECPALLLLPVVTGVGAVAVVSSTSLTPSMTSSTIVSTAGIATSESTVVETSNMGEVPTAVTSSVVISLVDNMQGRPVVTGGPQPSSHEKEHPNSEEAISGAGQPTAVEEEIVGSGAGKGAAGVLGALLAVMMVV